MEKASAGKKGKEACEHSIVVFDMCADCGLNLRRSSSTAENFLQPVSASVSMIHGIPELRVSQKEAEELGHKDRMRLLKNRKLALIVDLDQTLVHTSMDPNIEPGLPDVYGFHLPDHPMLYHCRLRPHTRHFLEGVARLYELHVFTMGTKSYAASVTRILDPQGKLFCDRIISRDECFDPRSKALRLKSVFPCGDSMVAIIDDREDVWGRCPNLVHVKPYMFFTGIADINAPPPLHHHARSRPPRMQHHHPHGRGGVGKGSHPRQAPPPHHDVHNTMKRMRVDTNQVHEDGQSTQYISNESTPKHHEAGSEQTAGLAGSMLESEMAVSSPPNDRDTARVLTTEHVSSTTSSQGGVVSVPVQPPAPGNGVSVSPQSPALVASPPACTLPENAVSASCQALSSGVVVSSTLTQSLGADQSTANSQSLLVNNNNNNNSNVDDGDGASKDGRESGTSDSSSDSGESSSSNSSSNSSGIDDTLFEQTPPPQDGEESRVRGKPLGGDGEMLEEGELNDESGAEGKEGVSVAASNSESPHGAERQDCSNNRLPSVSQPDHMADRAGRRKIREINDPDDFLLHLLDILERIHQIFYQRYDAIYPEGCVDSIDSKTPPTDSTHTGLDLKQIIPELRQSILKDCRVLFTGVIPTNMPARKNPEWNTARAFGATIHASLVPGLNSCKQEDVLSATTHVIAGKPGTSKLLEARRMPGVKIVSPRWLWACAECWRKVEEEKFPAVLEKRKGSEDGIRKPPPKEEPEQPKLPHAGEEGGGEVRREGENAQSMAEAVHGSELERESDDSDNDDIFNKSSFTELAKMDTTELKRHLSMESRLSVSDAELEKMDAEVEAEISSSSSSSEEEGQREELGSHVEFIDNEDNLSYEKFAGTHATQDIDVLERLRRKRAFADLEASSSSESLLVEQLNESFVSDNDLVEEESGEEEDELGALLGF